MKDPMTIEDSWERMEWTLTELIGGNTPELDPDWYDPTPEVYDIGLKWVRFLREWNPPFPQPGYIIPSPVGGITLGFYNKEVGPGNVSKIEIDIENSGDVDFLVFYDDGGISTFSIGRDSLPVIPYHEERFPYFHQDEEDT